VGMAGPVTNQAPNESRIAASYRTYGQLLAFSARRPRDGAERDVPMLPMFCAAFRREVFVEVGLLDERFGLGMFEDDDYAMRLHAAGYRTVCAEDVFVHHFGGGSLGELVPTGEFRQVFDRNRAYFEQKWGVPWTPHSGREDERYEQVRQAFRAAVTRLVPEGSRVAVVSKGDDRLLELAGRVGSHFPRYPHGAYAGYYPADADQAVEWVAALRRGGFTHLVFPVTGVWWLEHYAGLRVYLEECAERCTSEGGPCVVYRFTDEDAETDDGSPAVQGFSGAAVGASTGRARTTAVAVPASTVTASATGPP